MIDMKKLGEYNNRTGDWGFPQIWRARSRDERLSDKVYD